MTDLAASVHSVHAPQPARPTHPPGTMRIQADPTFGPCPVEDGDEPFPNSIFEFNVTRILEHVARHPAEHARALRRTSA